MEILHSLNTWVLILQFSMLALMEGKYRATTNTLPSFPTWTTSSRCSPIQLKTGRCQLTKEVKMQMTRLLPKGLWTLISQSLSSLGLLLRESSLCMSLMLGQASSQRFRNWVWLLFQLLLLLLTTGKSTSSTPTLHVSPFQTKTRFNGCSSMITSIMFPWILWNWASTSLTSLPSLDPLSLYQDTTQRVRSSVLN